MKIQDALDLHLKEEASRIIGELVLEKAATQYDDSFNRER